MRKVLSRWIVTKISICLIGVIYYGLNTSNCYSISDSFKFMIDTIGIPEYNVLGERINEDIYYAYNVFIYSDPINVMRKTNLQRFKGVEDNGKFSEFGTGIKGEYYILGTNYSGALVTNVYFPVDFVAETTPDNWNFLYNENALNSWCDTSKFKRKEQLEYMKNTNIQFDKIDYVNNTSNSYDLVEYNINANKIGLDKAVLETCSTWKTSGIISVNRLSSDNKVRYATFFAKPMAASADIKSNLLVQDNINLNEEHNYIDIEFGASAINLNDYAKEEHIKEIYSEIYIDNVKIDTIKNSSTVNIDKKILYEVPLNTFESDTKILNIKVKSYLYTEFSIDGLMKNEIEKNITIHKNILSQSDKVPANNIIVKKLEKINGNYFVSSLMKTDETEKFLSKGIIEKGKYIAIKVLDFNTSEVNLDNLHLNINEKEYKYDIVKINEDSVIIKIKIEEDENILNSIATWKYLKEKNENYFDINFNSIGKRVNFPNILKLCFIDKNLEFEISFDAIDQYLYNINYTFLQRIVNKSEYYEKIMLEDWIK